MNNKKISFRLDDSELLMFNSIVGYYQDKYKIQSQSAVIKRLLKNEYKMIVESNLADDKTDIDQIKVKLDYLFEYLELLLKVNDNLAEIIIDSDGNENIEEIKKYVNGKSKLQKYVATKIGDNYE